MGAEAMCVVRRVLDSLPATASTFRPAATATVHPPASHPQRQHLGKSHQNLAQKGNTVDTEARRRRTCTCVVINLERAIHQSDTMAIDKTLRMLIERIVAGEVDYNGLEAAGVGPLLGDLLGFEGDTDIRDLAQRALA